MELIKNVYDVDVIFVLLDFLNILKFGGMFVIKDDGVGMLEEIIWFFWMRILIIVKVEEFFLFIYG